MLKNILQKRRGPVAIEVPAAGKARDEQFIANDKSSENSLLTRRDGGARTEPMSCNLVKGGAPTSPQVFA